MRSEFLGAEQPRLSSTPQTFFARMMGFAAELRESNSRDFEKQCEKYRTAPHVSGAFGFIETGHHLRKIAGFSPR
ncbi:hypothetical protein SAMN04488523_101169 [Sulfitobacter brevis]|uniref:Uncharacterized protein n=1 Tax=Sulfitobacter brevis TaxID=74348 RepID=A0A1I1SUT6_9RHOB|nr:hypothetical protein SAMN04488523_101169 [Sulfitobacter brevis]